MSMQWYIIHTYSGFEKKVKESLESRVAAFSLQDKIGRVLIPMEDVVEVRGGKKVVSSRMSYPGYVLVEMDLDENTWHIVRNTPRVTGFVGSATSPSPLSEAEVDAIINRVHTPQDRPKPKVVYERNEQVRIVDGPFANFNGTVEEIDNDHSRLKGFGDDFRAFDAGRAGFCERRKAGIRESRRPRQSCREQRYEVKEHAAKEDTDNHQAAIVRGQSDAGAAGGHRARPPWREHHGFLQAVQRQDAERTGWNDFSGAGHDLYRPHIHVHPQDSASVGAAIARCGNCQGFARAESQQSRQSNQEAG